MSNRASARLRYAFLLALAVCALPAAPGWAAQTLGTLLRANLHTHSSASTGSADHLGAESPANLLIRAKSLGLTCVAITDHGEAITATEWSQIAQACAAPPAGLTALRGCEWTLSGLLPGTGVQNHLNLFGASARAMADLNGAGADATLSARHAH